MSRLSGQSDGKRLLLTERKLNTSITVEDSSYPVVIAVHSKQNENSRGKKKKKNLSRFTETLSGMHDKGRGLKDAESLSQVKQTREMLWRKKKKKKLKKQG